jgi:hypothetical protein
LLSISHQGSFFQGGEDNALAPFAPRIAKDLCLFLPAATDDTLGLMLEALSVVVEIDTGSWVTPELVSSLIETVLDVWHKNNRGASVLSAQPLLLTYISDPIFVSIITDIMTTFSGANASGVYETVVKAALPPLSDAIAHAKKEESWIASTGIDLVTSLARGAPDSGLGDGFFALVVPALFASVGGAEDRDVIQVCVSLL